MKISKQARRDARQLLRSCFVKDVLDETHLMEVVRRIARARPRGYLAILAHFQRLVKLEMDRRAAVVESAVPLPQELASNITNNLNRLYGAGLKISFAQNPALIAGLRVKVGSDVYDGSVRARLNRLTEGF